MIIVSFYSPYVLMGFIVNLITHILGVCMTNRWREFPQILQIFFSISTNILQYCGKYYEYLIFKFFTYFSIAFRSSHIASLDVSLNGSFTLNSRKIVVICIELFTLHVCTHKMKHHKFKLIHGIDVFLISNAKTEKVHHCTLQKALQIGFLFCAFEVRTTFICVRQ